MSETLTYNRTLRLVVVECCSCTIEYGIPETLNRTLLEQKARKSTTCPNGHHWHYTGLTAEEQIARAEARATHERDQREAAERRAAAARGQVTKLKNRVAAGICPCCKRHFVNLERHMGTKHPDFAKEDDT